ncbi:Las1-like-domain-containing protein [Flammula alnicola]|nr:Las1-like-domain-containing protein [Flammula alnicola]
MRLPRRVPWSSLAELEQICACIYGDESDIESKIFAIHRISAWKAVTALPHAIESTLALLVVIVQDEKQISLSALSLRQSYATAILRLVNGLVDPLQVGTYARSIISIAQQLGIPSWLVELRHAATHEDLPSLDLLREASRQSMLWLLNNYFLPTLNPVSTAQQMSTPIRPLTPMLKLYRNTMKTVTRDVSLMTQYRPRLVNILRDLERWIAESKLVANVAAGEVGWTIQSLDGTATDIDAKETWALERFCDGLAEKGMLVPLSKKKRQPSSDSLFPSKASIAFWDPLLRHAQAMHTDFPHVLCRRFVSILLGPHTANEGGEPKSDPSYYMYIACWVSWTIKTWINSLPSYIDLKKDTLSNLMKGLGYDPSLMSSQSAYVIQVLNLTSGQGEFEAITALLLRPPSQIPKTAWDPNDLDVMKERHDLLQAYQLSTAEALPDKRVLVQNPAHDISAPGWRTLEENKDWQCCPIGVYVN